MKAIILATLALFTTVVAGQETPQTQRERIRAEVNLVTLRFTIRDAQGGGFVNALSKDPFQVFENGVAQEVRFFEGPRNKSGKIGRLWLAFLIDVSGSTFATRSEEIIAAQTFLDNVHSFTQVGIFGFTDKLIPFQDFTSSREAALRAFSAARQHLGRTAIYESIDALVSKMTSKSATEEEKVIIVISDGMHNAHTKRGSITARSTQTVANARKHNVHFYTILVPSAAQLYIGPAANGSNDGSNGDVEEKQAAFASLSLQTGGKHHSGFEAVLDFDQTLALVNDDIFGNLYSIGYYTDDPYRDKRSRNIRVHVNHPNVEVSSLFENVPERMYAKKKFVAALFDNEALSRLPGNLQTSFQEIGAELDLLTPRQEGGQIGIPFRIKISPYTLKGTAKEGVRTQFGIIGILLDHQGHEVVRLREFFRVTLGAKEIRDGRSILYTNKLLAPPGNYEFKVALLEMGTWKMTAFENAVRITGE